jgi:hypothetical protein
MVDSLPNLSIALVTYKRTAEALETIRSTSERLVYPKDKRAWYINDDGSPAGHLDAVISELLGHGETLIGYNNTRFGGGTYNCGKGWNLALGNAHQNSDFVLWLEDDWRLDYDLDISRYVKMLEDRDDVGLVRLGTLAVGNDVSIMGHQGVHYLKYHRDQPYAYSGNPCIRHARFVKAYGWFSENLNPGNIELNYDEKFRTTPGPDIWRPAEINPWGAWGHLGREKAYE